MSEKEILIVAGPNGAGKTTFARDHLDLEARGFAFLNADLIAAGLAPSEPVLAGLRAGQHMLAELDRLAADGQNFAFETTLSGRGYLRRIQRWRNDGYFVTLLFLWLPSADFAVMRVHQRIALGGHSVPDEVVRRRYRGGLDKLHRLYAPAVDAWVLLDNQEGLPKMIEQGGNLD